MKRHVLFYKTFSIALHKRANRYRLILRYAVVFLFLIMSISGCDSEKPKNAPITEMEVIQDLNFDGGLLLLGNDSSSPNNQDTLFPYTTANARQATIWRLAEWGSKHVLDHPEAGYHSDTVVFSNQAKRISFIKDHENNRAVVLEIITSHEYSSPRKQDENWPHLLLEQYATERILLDSLDSLILDLDASLLYSDQKMDPEAFNENLHTSQISLYFAIGDSLDFLWYGLPIYDYRYPDGIDAYAAQDLGKEDATQKFIFRIGSAELFDGSLQKTGNLTMHIDLLPSIKDAFHNAQKKGYLAHTKQEDLYIKSFNVGWETPGTFDSGIVLSGFRVTGFKSISHE